MTGNGGNVNLLKLAWKNSSNHIRVFSKLIFGGFRSFGTTSNTYLLTKFLWLKHNFHFSAPTDVLEALNRVLDDNRELFIPETQTLIKAHTNFRLFATQNPTGSYGGRKPLSRAFRNRFVELHFDELPHQELSEIIEKRAGIARSQRWSTCPRVFGRFFLNHVIYFKLRRKDNFLQSWANSQNGIYFHSKWS